MRRLARWTMATLISVATMTSLTVSAETATLRVSIDGGAFNSKFKFFDASEGCPGYNDIPGAKDYLGSVLRLTKVLIKAYLWVSQCRCSSFGRKRPSAFRLAEAKKKFADARCRWC